MDHEVQEMLQAALLALVERDPDGAREVLRRDDVVDKHWATVTSKMTDYIASHSADVPAGLRVMWVANNLERIADHATNVAEEVIFMVRGEDVRHLRPDRLGRRGPTWTVRQRPPKTRRSWKTLTALVRRLPGNGVRAPGKSRNGARVPLSIS